MKLHVAAGIPAGRGDPRQIRNAVAEVILNAIQATRAAEIPGDASPPREVSVQVRFDPLDSQAIVQVSDRGVGMSEEVMRQAFSPFFSAKSAGRNRGMGLAKALRWIENHGGTIRLDSAPGAGTTAVILIPLSLSASPAPSPHQPEIAGARVK